MNTIHLSTAHPPCPRPAIVEEIARIPERTPRTTAGDRIAMRVGLWLLLWGTRPAGSDERARRRHAAQRVAEQARLEHEAAVARARMLHGGPFIR